MNLEGYLITVKNNQIKFDEKCRLPTADSFETHKDLFVSLDLEKNYPFSVTLEITRKCNYRCIHCYLDDCREVKELTTEELKSVLTQLKEAGTVCITMTGGEPLVHPDFKEIWKHQYELGFLTTLFTNGALITEEMAKFLVKYLPHNIEVSLYTDETARVNTSKTWEGIDNIRKYKLPFELKTMALKQNIGKLGSYQRKADEWGVLFSIDTKIYPTFCNVCNLKPLNYSLSLEEIAEVEKG